MADTYDWIVPQWPASCRVRALSTTRSGGVSLGPYTSLNLGDHVGDDPCAVAENRLRVRQALALPCDPTWLQQIHGVRVVEARPAAIEKADASIARGAGVVCAVMTADCLPVLFSDRAGSVVAAAHAGWRGLQNGVLEATVADMAVAPDQIIAWLGPAIGPDAFEVGSAVRDAFVAAQREAADAFRPSPQGRWLADIYALARQRLARVRVAAVYGGDSCTYNDPLRFYSFRRDGVTGRMASLIWLAD